MTQNANNTNNQVKHKNSPCWHAKSKEDVLKELNVKLSTGLSTQDAKKRKSHYGNNEIEGKKKENIILRFFAQFKDFMIIILILAALVSFFASYLQGHADLVDPAIIFAIIILNALLGVIQEAKAEKSLEALKKMSAPNALVLRDGKETYIPSKNLVPGDIIFLETGNYVPADCRLLSSVNLKIDESSLTGESHPVEKDSDIVLKKDTIIGDRTNLANATGIITYGRGIGVVTSIGMNTEVGLIAKMILEDDVPLTPLQKKLEQTGKILGIAALCICVVIFAIGIIQGRPAFDMFMTSVSLAVAAIPEGLPAIVTIMLSLGVQRMAKKNAVIRRLPAVETLGSATVICSDKTGTLTQNKMTVTKISSCKNEESLNSSMSNATLFLASLCNDAKLQEKKSGIEAIGEPTETALILAANKCGIIKSKNELDYPRVFEIPFDSARKMMTTVHKFRHNASPLFLDSDYSHISITKGAPDILLENCKYYYQDGSIIPFTQDTKQSVMKHNNAMTKDALRVIAVAFSPKKSFQVPQKLTQGYMNELENNLVFVGLIGMIDPPRPEVKASVLTCKKAGIKPVMITGDHISTACAIGKSLDIISSNKEAISGQDLNKMTDVELGNKIDRYGVFARVSPEHKVRIVKAFQAKGNIVAMTGDGVNDAPALKSADIGCAMGITGTDVAKNAADMILTDDNFATIVSAVSEGRGIYDNIKKSIHFLLSSNIGEIMTILVAILFGMPSPLVAVQLLWVNLVTDSLPAISLGVEPPDKDIMKRNPISPSKSMFSDGLSVKIILEGLMIGSLALIAYILGSRTLCESNLTLGRTMCFAVLSLSQLFHAFNMRSEHSLFEIGLFSNMKLLLSFFVCTLLQIVVISNATLAKVFKVTPLTIPQWSFVFALAFAPIFIIELQKHITK